MSRLAKREPAPRVMLSFTERCPRCNGLGRIADEFGEPITICPRCDGRAELPTREATEHVARVRRGE